jgi:hypothetical protein
VKNVTVRTVLNQHFRFILFCHLILATAALMGLSGCSSVTSVAKSVNAQDVTSGNSFSLSGNVMGGQQPLAGASIQIYAAGTSGNGSAATALLSKPVTAGADGSFTVNDSITCPATSAQIYVVATGSTATGSNDNATLMALAGTCANLSKSLTINEITTVGAVSALAPYMNSASSVGVSSADGASFDTAVTLANGLVNFATGAGSGPELPAGSAAPVPTINTLADMMAACVNSNGGQAGDG